MPDSGEMMQSQKPFSQAKYYLQSHFLENIFTAPISNFASIINVDSYFHLPL